MLFLCSFNDPGNTVDWNLLDCSNRNIKRPYNSIVSNIDSTSDFPEAAGVSYYTLLRNFFFRKTISLISIRVIAPGRRTACEAGAKKPFLMDKLRMCMHTMTSRKKRVPRSQKSDGFIKAPFLWGVKGSELGKWPHKMDAYSSNDKCAPVKWPCRIWATFNHNFMAVFSRRRREKWRLRDLVRTKITKKYSRAANSLFPGGDIQLVKLLVHTY